MVLCLSLTPLLHAALVLHTFTHYTAHTVWLPWFTHTHVWFTRFFTRGYTRGLHSRIYTHARTRIYRAAPFAPPPHAFGSSTCYFLHSVYLRLRAPYWFYAFWLRIAVWFALRTRVAAFGSFGSTCVAATHHLRGTRLTYAALRLRARRACGCGYHGYSAPHALPCCRGSACLRRAHCLGSRATVACYAHSTYVRTRTRLPTFYLKWRRQRR